MGKRQFRTILRFIGLADDITAIPRLIWIGGGAVMVALGHIFEAIRNLPLGYQILFAVGVLLLWLAGVLFVVGWLRRRKQPLPTGRSNEVDPQTQRYADWMTVAIQDDVGDLPGCIIVPVPHISWEHLEEKGDAYIEFNFNIWSSSVHLLEINKTVEGNIWFQDGELERTPVITQKASQLDHLRRSRSAQFTVRQWLSFTVKVDMKTKYNNPVEFGFGGVNISVTATLPDGSQGHTFRLPIPVKVCTIMPNHPNAPVPDREDSQTE